VEDERLLLILFHPMGSAVLIVSWPCYSWVEAYFATLHVQIRGADLPNLAKIDTGGEFLHPQQPFNIDQFLLILSPFPVILTRTSGQPLLLPFHAGRRP
jgi:hypothetical protein